MLLLGNNLYLPYVLFVHVLCTTRTWLMYEPYSPYVLKVHALCTNRTWLVYEKYMTCVRNAYNLKAMEIEN